MSPSKNRKLNNNYVKCQDQREKKKGLVYSICTESINYDATFLTKDLY